MAAGTKAARSIAFRLHPRVFAALGSDLVTSDAVALIELVKNAYDALATQVDVRFIGEDGVQPTAIEVTDNGTGMTLNELSKFWVANQHKLLFAAVGSEAKVIDPLFVVLRLAFDHCVLRLEATLGLENGRAVGLPAIGSGDADVQRCVAVCHEIPLNPILRDKELLRF